MSSLAYFFMNNNAIELVDLRLKIDQLNEKILSGLKARSHYPLNLSTFSDTFAEGKSWFLYRLKKEQEIELISGLNGLEVIFREQIDMLPREIPVM